MADVFIYNTGSLLQALKPEQNLAPLDDQPWVEPARQAVRRLAARSTASSTARPFGTAFGGGVLYNMQVYKKLGLKVPKTWAEFMANNAKIKSGRDRPRSSQTYGDTWTSQLFVLADYHNVAGRGAGLRREYTAEQGEVRHHAGGRGGFQHIAGGQGRRLLQQGLRLGQVRRRR